MREEVAADIRTIFHASDLAEAQRRLQSVAQKYRESAHQLRKLNPRPRGYTFPQ
jgi:hypothetical protein